MRWGGVGEGDGSVDGSGEKQQLDGMARSCLPTPAPSSKRPFGCCARRQRGRLDCRQLPSSSPLLSSPPAPFYSPPSQQNPEQQLYSLLPLRIHRGVLVKRPPPALELILARAGERIRRGLDRRERRLLFWHGGWGREREIETKEQRPRRPDRTNAGKCLSCRVRSGTPSAKIRALTGWRMPGGRCHRAASAWRCLSVRVSDPVRELGLSEVKSTFRLGSLPSEQMDAFGLPLAFGKRTAGAQKQENRQAQQAHAEVTAAAASSSSSIPAPSPSLSSPAPRGAHATRGPRGLVGRGRASRRRVRAGHVGERDPRLEEEEEQFATANEHLEVSRVPLTVLIQRPSPPRDAGWSGTRSEHGHAHAHAHAHALTQPTPQGMFKESYCEDPWRDLL